MILTMEPRLHPPNRPFLNSVGIYKKKDMLSQNEQYQLEFEYLVSVYAKYNLPYHFGGDQDSLLQVGNGVCCCFFP